MSEQSIKAKPTIYRGTQFRSRLEARAAAAFDRKGWSWRYEVDNYQAGNTGYTPDFFIEESFNLWPFWIEVKPNMAAVDDDHKARQFAREVNGKVFYGVEGESFLHRPKDVWESEVWVSPLRLYLIDVTARQLVDTGTFLILPQYLDGDMIWPADE